MAMHDYKLCLYFHTNVCNANKFQTLTLESFSTATNALGNTTVFRRYPNGMKSLHIYGIITNTLIKGQKYNIGTVGGLFLPFETVVKRVIYTGQGNVGMIEYNTSSGIIFTPITVPDKTGQEMYIFEVYY